MPGNASHLGPEKLAQWYLRLNGFLMIPNFIVHPDQGIGIQTDIDLLGVRFPFRSEGLKDPMEDDEHFRSGEAKPFIALAEVKTNWAGFNKSWLNPKK